MCLFHFNPFYKGLRTNWPWSSSANTNTSMVLSDGWIVHIYSGWWLSPTPLKNMSSSVGMMTFPIYGKMKNVPNHQPVLVLSCVILWFSTVWQPGRLVWGVIPYENLEVEKGLEWYINMAEIKMTCSERHPLPLCQPCWNPSSKAGKRTPWLFQVWDHPICLIFFLGRAPATPPATPPWYLTMNVQHGSVPPHTATLFSHVL